MRLRALAPLLAVVVSLAGEARAAALVAVQSFRLTDACSVGGPASGNGVADPGEAGDLLIRLENRGNVTAARLRVLVTSADPMFEVLLDTVDLADLPAGGSVEMPAIPWRLSSDASCGASFQVDLTIAYNGTFRPDNCRIDVPAQCFACGADPCHPDLLVPFSPGPYGNELLQTAGDFTVPTLDGDVTFSAAWSGCDSWVLIVHYPGNSYSDVMWNASVLALLQQSPKNAHYVFLSAAADPLADVTGMKTRTDAALARLPVVDQDHWRPRLHHVTAQAQGLGNWISEFIIAHGPPAFAIDTFQKVRQVGLLFFVGGPQSPELRFLAHEVRSFNFERDRQRQLDYESYSVVTVWDGVLMNSGQADVAFPDAATMARYDTMLFDLSWACTDPWNSRSCEWDYLANLYLCDPADPTQCGQEFGRWITAYGRGGRWVTDMTPYMALISGGGTRRLSFYTPYQYTMTLKIYFANRHRGVRPVAASFLHSGGNFEDPSYNANHPPVTVDAPSWLRRAEIAALITGHGFGNNAENCAEFCNHQHRFTVGGVSVMQEFPEAQTQTGCVDQIETGTVPNQYGTWHYGRGGWCPGLDVPAYRGDVTAGVTPGVPNVVTYEGLYNGAPYVPGPISNPNGFGARIDMSSYIVFFAESPEADCADGLDDDGDGNVDCADQGCESQPECAGFDTDGDGTINQDDCDALDGTLAQSPAGHVMVHVSKDASVPAHVQWHDLDAAAGTSTMVDVMTGLVSELRADRNFSRGTCLARDAQGGVDDLRPVPGAQDAFWYIIRADNRCGSVPFDPPELQAASPCD